MIRISLVTLSFLLAYSTFASDLERERRLVSEIEDTIVFGDPIQLDADGQAFFAIYTESETDEPAGSAIVLHGRGFHPDWPLVAGPIRSGLAERGWHTLSIQLPVLAVDAKYYDYEPIFPEAFPRIDAAIRYAREQSDGPVALVAHSCGVHMAMAYVRMRSDADIDAFVGIGMGATDLGQPMREPFPLAAMRVPVLDVYGAKEYPAVVRMAPERQAAIESAGNRSSRQLVIDEADHYFTGDTATSRLVDVVADWLNSTAFPGIDK